MSSISPANSSISTTAVIGGGGGGSSSNVGLSADEFYFPSDLISLQDRKDEALNVIKSDLTEALNKVVKSMDEDSWMFEGPVSRMNLVSRRGGFLHQQMEIPYNRNSIRQSKS